MNLKKSYSTLFQIPFARNPFNISLAKVQKTMSKLYFKRSLIGCFTLEH